MVLGIVSDLEIVTGWCNMGYYRSCEEAESGEGGQHAPVDGIASECLSYFLITGTRYLTLAS